MISAMSRMAISWTLAAVQENDIGGSVIYWKKLVLLVGSDYCRPEAGSDDYGSSKRMVLSVAVVGASSTEREIIVFIAP